MRNLRNLLIGLTIFLVVNGCSHLKESMKRTEPEMSLNVATEILTTQAIHDAVMVVPNGTWHSSPALADLDNDGDLEIIVAVGERMVGAWHHDGRPVAGWPQPCERIVCSPAVADVDNDGKLEIATPGYLWRADGQLMPGWPIGRGHSFCTPSLADVDSDGKLEILYTDNDKGLCIRHYDGTILPGWPMTFSDNDIRCTPIAYDIDGDGKKEIVFIRSENEVRVYRVDGTPFPGYPKRFPISSQQCFVFADVNGDGKIVLINNAKAINLLDGSMTVFRQSGSGISPCLYRDKKTGKLVGAIPYLPYDIDFHLPADISGNNSSWSDNVAVADIDGNGELEMLFGNREGGYHAYRNNGTQAAGWPKRLNPVADCGISVGDLDGDGYFEVVANAGGGRIYIFGCPGSADGEAPWPMFMANNCRNGFANATLVPRAKKTISAISVEAKMLHQALASGDWDKAIALYHRAIAVVEKNAKKLGVEQTKQLKQSGILSIARILNTRAKRFNEAAEMYLQAITIAPETWAACQSLAECSDLVMLHNKLATAKTCLNKAVTISLPPLKTMHTTDADLYRLVVAQSCVLLDRDEGLELCKTIIQNQNAATPAKSQSLGFETRRPTNYLVQMASDYITFQGVPFLVEFQEEQTTRVTTKSKDLTAESPKDAKILFYLGISPHSQTLERLPMHARLNADPNLASCLEGTWTTGSDGRLYQEQDKSIPSSDLNSQTGDRFTLVTRPYTENDVTVRREVERIDETHMKVKLFLQSNIGEINGWMRTLGTPAKVDPTSVRPSSNMRSDEYYASFNTWQPNRTPDGKYQRLSASTGFNVEAIIELPKGMKIFYPETTIRSLGSGMANSVKTQLPTHSISGSFAGVNYELISPRKFKLIPAYHDSSMSFTLEKLDAE